MAPVTVVEHKLHLPGAITILPTPDIMDGYREILADLPKAQRSRWIGSPAIPARQRLPSRCLVLAEQKHVDIGMESERAANEMVDGMTTGDPPGKLSLLKQYGDLPG